MGSGIRRNRKKNKKNEWRQDKGGGKNWSDIVRSNSEFDKFYLSQKICSSESEFQEMLEAMRRDLPTTFRVTGFRKANNFVREVLRRTGCGKEIPWCPLAWQIPLSRKEIRRDESYVALHNFLISETESGFISRQETVSMIPPLVLDVHSHHKVLDMCAAPGSKTAQIIEALHKDADSIPEGFVVANDADNARCYMLVHQAKRLQSPCVLVTNHDASIIPNFTITGEEGKKNLKFDRILCDVPCSGDGTLRKNADIWPKWNPHSSNTLHGMQYRILKRGLELLDIGGRLVYSTCSLNPVENEAVLCRMLKETGESVKIVDGSSLVTGLKFKEGLTTWTVSDKEYNSYSKFEEVPNSAHSLVRPFMFPPENESEALQIGIKKVMRVLPHLQDTGGFFVAVLEKSGLCPWEKVRNKESDTGAEKSAKEEPVVKQPPSKKLRYQGYKEDPFMYFEENDSVFEKIKSYYKIEGLNSKMFLTRCKDTTKRNILYFTSLQLRDLITNSMDKVKLVNAGVKAFARCENKGSECEFRLSQEGARMTLPFIKKRKVKTTKKDLEILLLSDDVEKPPAISLMEEPTQELFNSIDTGSVAYIYEEIESDGSSLSVELVGWKGKTSVRAYVVKNERIHYLRLIGGNTSKFEKNKFEERREKEAKNESSVTNNIKNIPKT